MVLSGFGGNGATMFFLIFALLASVFGVISKFAGGNHIRMWRNDSLAYAGATSILAWALTALAFGYYYILLHSSYYIGIWLILLKFGGSDNIFEKCRGFMKIFKLMGILNVNKYL